MMKSTSSPTDEVEIQDPDANLDVSTAPPEKEKKSWQPSDPSKTEKPWDRTASTQHKFFSHSLW